MNREDRHVIAIVIGDFICYAIYLSLLVERNIKVLKYVLNLVNYDISLT